MFAPILHRHEIIKISPMVRVENADIEMIEHMEFSGISSLEAKAEPHSWSPASVNVRWRIPDRNGIIAGFFPVSS